MNHTAQQLLIKFERAVRSEPAPAATTLLAKLLHRLSEGAGQVPPDVVVPYPVSDLGTFECHVANRLACAMSSLFLRPDWELSAQGYSQLMRVHRWIGAIFAATDFQSCDFILEQLGMSKPKSFMATADPQALMKFALLYGIESRIQLSLTELFVRAPLIGTELGLALVSPRLVATPAAREKREVALNWLVEALSKLETLDSISAMPIADIFMHSSYADTATKHAYKAPLNRLIRRWMVEHGIIDLGRTELRETRPSIMVILEWFKQNHSIMRTHSRSMATLRDRYTLIGVGQKGNVDEAGQAIFDEYATVGGPLLQTLAHVRTLACVHRPTAIYYPSIGMMPLTLYLMNLRLAPHQFMGLGHPATTHSEQIDYALVEEDYIGDPNCFSETVIPLPHGSMPYLKPSDDSTPPAAYSRCRDVVRIGVPAYIMKLNSGFLATCAKIAERAGRPLEFHFFVGGAVGFMHSYARKAITYQVPNAIVHAHQPIHKYLNSLSKCDMFINPFPFGNTNGLVDTFGLRLPGVCMTGPEVHTHIDEGLFRRMGMPDWTIARSSEEYIDATLRLISDPELRESISEGLTAERLQDTVFNGRPEQFSQIVESTIGKAR